MISVLTWLLVSESISTSDVSNLCETKLFMIIRLGGEFVTFVFFILGIIITVKIKSIQRTTKYEKKIENA